MKLYVWSGDDVLRNYSSGVALAFAESVEEARDLVLRAVKPQYDWIDWESPDEDDADFIKEKTAFISREPRVHTSAIGFAIPGSD